MKRVLFVDDEPNVLSGLKRMLRPMRHDWEMEFYDNGVDAIASLETAKCDVVVSDMRMPIMDGATLLSKVREKHPESIRIALSGQADATMIYRCIKHAHQYLAKPCDADHLIATVNRACDLQDMLGDERLKSLVSNLTSLPSLPEAYKQIMDELQSEDASLENVGRIIESDMAMAAKTLQLVNSAYFGLPRHVSSPSEAAIYLGVDVIKSLALVTGIFSQFDARIVRSIGLKDVGGRSIRIGALARDIAIGQTGDTLLGDYALMAGMLNDIGTLVLAVGCPKELAKAHQTCMDQNRFDWEVERELLGYSHMEVGAYLVALWGLPNPIVEAVAYHHRPDECAHAAFEPLTAVHVANALVRSKSNGHLPDLDVEYIDSLGLTGRITHWQSLKQTMDEKSGIEGND